MHLSVAKIEVLVQVTKFFAGCDRYRRGVGDVLLSASPDGVNTLLTCWMLRASPLGRNARPVVLVSADLSSAQRQEAVFHGRASIFQAQGFFSGCAHTYLGFAGSSFQVGGLTPFQQAQAQAIGSDNVRCDSY